MNSKNLVNYSSDEFNNLSQFQQEEITSYFVQNERKKFAYR